MPFLGKSRTLFRIFGVPVKIDLSWFLILALLIWTLASSWFPFQLGDEGSALSYWLWAVVGAFAFFASLLAHELSHSLVAKATGMPVGGITLFIFGGVSELEEEPPTAPAEFFMAVVGPASSVMIGITVLIVWWFAPESWPAALVELLQWLWTVNFMLAIFNSIPAFPLDGGRVLRSFLWGITENLNKATRISAMVGSGFGIMLLVLGVYLAVQGFFIRGIWAIFIGLFLRQAAMGAVRQLVMRQQLEGEPIRRFMTPGPVTVTPELTLREFVDNYVLNYHFTYFPVVDETGALTGIVQARDPRQIHQRDWDEATVGDVMSEVDEKMLLHPEVDAVEALSRLRGDDTPRLIVVDAQRRPMGVLSLRDLMDFLALKIDLSPRQISRT